MGNIRISPSALKAFDTCKAAYKYSREWQLIEGQKSPSLTFGSKVHEYMADPSLMSRPDGDDSFAWDAAQRLRNLEERMGFTIKHRELVQDFALTPTVTMRRILDAVGEDRDGQSCIIDYKTARVRWKTIASGDGFVSPDALGWQTVCYLTPPPKDVLKDMKLRNWPAQMYYLIVPNATGSFTPQVITVKRDKKREAELLQQVGLIEQAHEAKAFPKSMGYGCNYCSFAAMCYNVQGHEALYERRK